MPIRFGFEARMPLSSLIVARTSLSSASSLSISRPVSLASRMLRMASVCFSLSPNRFRSRASACGVSAEPRMILMTSSMLSTAILRPSRMCSRASAALRSNCVRRTMISCRCSMYRSSNSFRFMILGAPLSSASMITPKVDCMAVCL